MPATFTTWIMTDQTFPLYSATEIKYLRHQVEPFSESRTPASRGREVLLSGKSKHHSRIFML